MAIAKSNINEQSNNTNEASTIVEFSVIDGGKKAEQKVPKGLQEIRKMLDSNLRSPARIYDSVLNSKQREVLCFAAGLKRKDIELKFTELNVDARQAIRKAIFECQNIFASFNDASAIETKKFFLPGEASVSSFDGQFNPANRIIAKEID